MSRYYYPRGYWYGPPLPGYPVLPYPIQVAPPYPLVTPAPYANTAYEAPYPRYPPCHQAWHYSHRCYSACWPAQTPAPAAPPQRGPREHRHRSEVRREPAVTIRHVHQPARPAADCGRTPHHSAPRPAPGESRRSRCRSPSPERRRARSYSPHHHRRRSDAPYRVVHFASPPPRAASEDTRTERRHREREREARLDDLVYTAPRRRSRVRTSWAPGEGGAWMTGALGLGRR